MSTVAKPSDSSELAMFEEITARFKSLLKDECFLCGATAALYIWDQRAFYAPKEMSSQQACSTICRSCIVRKMSTNPPRPPRGESSEFLGRQ